MLLPAATTPERGREGGRGKGGGEEDEPSQIETRGL